MKKNKITKRNYAEIIRNQAKKLDEKNLNK